MIHLKTSSDELNELLDKSTALFDQATLRLARALFDGKGLLEARKNMETLIGHTMTLADLFGRKRIWMEADALNKGAKMNPFWRK